MKTLVLGNALVDVILNIQALPKRGDDIACLKQTIAIGGCAYNVATILKHFNVEHELVVPIGRGPYADLIKSDLMSQGYDLIIQENHMDNGYCLCLVEDDGERTFLTVPGVETYYQKSWLDKLDLADVKRLYVSGYELDGPNGHVIVEWLQQWRELTIYFAPGPRFCVIDKKRLIDMFKLSPILHLNESEALSFTNNSEVLEAAKALHELTKNKVYITLGEAGVLVYHANGREFIEGYKTEVVNTIGAGDSHIGSILAMESMGYSDRECCEIANKVAAKVVGLVSSKLENEHFELGDYV